MASSDSTWNLQDRFAPQGRCFGCGPANALGLRVKSRVVGQELHADWRPSPHHEAFEGVLCGGIIGSLLDCHSNWAAAWHLMQVQALEAPPCTVTADYHVKLRRPTPSSEPLRLVAALVSLAWPRAEIDASLTSGGKVTATCRGTFVAVGPEHPAYHRW